MITHWKINVTSLAAITANLGTVNAGTINGVTVNGSTISGSVIYGSEINGGVIYGGNGAVTLDGNGLSFASGSGTPNRVKWNNGAAIYGHGDYLSLVGPNYVTMDTPGASVGLANGAFWPAQQLALGTSGAKWGELHVANNIFFENPPETTFEDHPLVWSQGNRQVYRRTDAMTGSVANPTWIQVRGGLIVDMF